ncbi:DUF6419 family natural product biosynthesis protein [Pseudoalteromonas sp. T1lg65]|uniref:DUF6419 family natural product biosynthesis protein n=1 Tax=Pseudoalteromonas sp. T1lg65 TaxID=2077101 RepID=UPI003F79AA69
MQFTIIYTFVLTSFFAMVASFHIYPQAVVVNLICCFAAAFFGYRGFTRSALLLCCINMLAMVFSSMLNDPSQLSLKAALVFACCVMFFGIALGCSKDTDNDKKANC